MSNLPVVKFRAESLRDSDYELPDAGDPGKSLLFHREGLYLVVVESLREELPDVICQDDESSLKTKPKP
jgi:hypothetical protein